MNSPAPQIAGDVGAGHVLGRYELLVPIATGGMAMVWAARLRGSRGFQKIVAVKTMLPKLSEDPQFEQMFLDEASHASQVRHPHVVEILDLGEQEGVLFLVMEWIDGVPLNQIIKAARKDGGSIPLAVAVRICMQACAGLHSAHELRDAQGQLVGLVHRDVSPQNVLVTYDGVTKVVDFGVAKATARGGGATAAGQVKGKAAYMAPEQIRDIKIDRRVDVFAMGVVLYALTTGKHPFRKDSEAATMYEICSPQPAPSPRKVIPGYPVALERVVMQALAKDPARRFPTANDMLRALDQALPSTMRASTDDEVAKVIRSLFGDKRESAKLALENALVRADQRAEQSQLSLKALLDSQPPPSVTAGSGVSAVSMVGSRPISVSGLVVPPPMSGAPADASGPYSQQLTAPSLDNLPPIRPKRRGGVVVGLALGLLALGAAGIYLWQSGVVAPPKVAAPTTATATATEAKPEQRPEPAAAPAATAQEEKPAGESPTEPTAKEEPAPKASKPTVRAQQPGKAKTPDKPSGGTTPPTWKHDPGF